MGREELDKVEELLREFLSDLREILTGIREEAPEKPTLDLKPFFDHVRKPLFGGRLQTSQVSGMEAKINEMVRLGFPLSWAAYVLATSYHETAKRMLPVREGLNVSDAWRKRHLRYYPWYGRGDVQLTWEDNYRRADEKLNLNGDLLSNPDLALDKDVSAKVITIGMRDGWFSKGNSLKTKLKSDEASREEFRLARPIVNLMDKAGMIADYAVIFQEALKRSSY